MFASDERLPAERVHRLFPTRQAYLSLALAFVAFAIYGSLLPFSLDPISLDSAWDRFRAAILNVPRRVSRSDILANALLFVPIGFTLAGSLLLDRRRRFAMPAAVGAILPLSLAISLIAEFLQTFTVDRTPSGVDIVAQTAGCLVGVGMWIIYGTTLTGWVRETRAATGDDRLFRLLVGYAFGWVFVNLAPFDITIDVGDLARRVRLGKIALSPFDGSGVMSARWAWDACAEILAALPLGVLGHVKSNRSTRRSPSAAFCLGAAIVLLVELAQIFLSSHSSKSTDVLFGWIGVGAGVSVGARLRRRSPEVGGLSELFSGPALATIAVWSLVLCAYHWLPYDFGVDSDAIKRKLAGLSLLPFAGYRSGSDLKALSDLLTKLALSAPFGVAAAFVLRNHVARRPIVVAGWMLVAACVFGAIELGQFFLPTRSPDTTDILTGMVGTFAGLSLGRWVQGESPKQGDRERP